MIELIAGAKLMMIDVGEHAQTMLSVAASLLSAEFDQEAEIVVDQSRDGTQQI